MFVNLILILALLGANMTADVSFTVEAIDKASSAITGIRGALLTMNQAVQLAGQAYQAVTRVIDATVGAYVKYAEQVRNLSQLNGTNAQETSRLIQVTDDYKISVDGLSAATRKLAGEGKSLTIDTLAKMSDEFKGLGTSADKTKYLLDNFGRTGTQFAEIMGAGSAAIIANTAAISKNLIMTEASLVQARDYEKQLDTLSDTWQGFKISAGTLTLPIVLKVLTTATQGVELGNSMDALNMRAAMGSVSYQDYQKSMNDFYNSLDSGELLILATTGDMSDMTEAAYASARGFNLSSHELFLMRDAVNAYIPSAEDAAAASLALQEALVDQTGWEAMYTGAENAAERAEQSFDMLGRGIQGISDEGADVWRAFMISSGTLSEPAIREFVRIEETILMVKQMLAEGMSVDVIVNFIAATQAQAAFEASRVSNGLSGGTKTLSQYATQADIDFARAHQDVYAPVSPSQTAYIPGGATGGHVSGRYVITGDSVSGKPTGFEELVDFQNKRVYNARDTRAMVGLGRGIPHFATAEGGGAGGGVNYIAPSPGDSGFDINVNPYNSSGNPDVPPYNNMGPLGGSGGSSAPIQQVVKAAVSAAVSASTASASVATTSVSKAAEQIAGSGERTAQATQENTQQNNQGNAAILQQLKSMNDMLDKALTSMPKQWAAAAARAI